MPLDAQAQPRTERRLEILHTLRFIFEPGNFLTLSQRVIRQALGREIIADKPGRLLNKQQIAQWLSASQATPASAFTSIQEHRRILATAYRSEMMHAVDRRRAVDMSVSERAIAVSLPDEDGRVLYEMVRDQQLKTCVEMGGAFGVGTRYLALALAKNQAGQLWTIELEQRRQELAMQALGELSVYVHPELGAVEEAMPRLGKERQDYDFYFVDALHTYDATWGYYQLIQQYTADTCLCVFHDVNSSGPMAKVWKRIVQHPATLEAMSWRRLGFCLIQGNALAQTHPTSDHTQS